MRTDGLTVDRIKNDIALAMVEREHYLHRKCPCTQAYGLFDEDKRIVGVIIYGCPASMPLKSGICGKAESEHVTELKRLWIEDGVPNYPESLLIGQSLKMMRIDHPELDIIVSYADKGFGHVGTVYQATNWIYTGFSAQRIDYFDASAKDKDPFTTSDRLIKTYGSIRKAREVLGDNLQVRPRGQKHRYIFFNTKSRQRKRYLLSQLRYRQEPYPKTDVRAITGGSSQNRIDRWCKIEKEVRDERFEEVSVLR